jgi:hypothetical protein
VGVFAFAVLAFAAGLLLVVFGVGIIAGRWRAGSDLRPAANSPLSGCLVAIWAIPLGLAMLASSWLAARDVPPIDWLYGGLYVASVVGPIATQWLLRNYPTRVDSLLAEIRGHLAKGVEPEHIELNDNSPAHTVIAVGLGVGREPASPGTGSYRDAPGTPDYAARVRAAVAAARSHEMRRTILGGLPTLAPALGVSVLAGSHVPISSFFTWVLYGGAALGALGLWLAAFTVQRIRVAADGIDRILLER